MIESIAHLGLLDDEEIDLDIAALELSALDHDGIDLAPYVAALDDFESELRDADGSDSAESGAEQADVLARILAVQNGFVGDNATYDAPLNADMIRVIDRRKGLPVSLSILYVALARRLGWEAEALNTPGHVLVRVGPKDDPVVIDPFHDGAVVSPVALVNLIRRSLGPNATLDQMHLAPMSNRMVLVRLLLNQATRAEQGGDSARALIIYERMVEVAPSNGQGWWDLARLQLAAGRIEDARISLSAMLEITRDAGHRAHISAALEKLAGRS
ncbi:MAG: tetratricopeptide repeat protein [Sphingomonadales bacterium]|nr:MAG: tetratricopeptide repeat protein [Sphingomonadales bacterium]